MLNEQQATGNDILQKSNISFGNGEYAVYIHNGRYIVYNECGQRFYTRLIDYEELGYYIKTYGEYMSNGNLSTLDDYLYNYATSVTWMDYRVICEYNKITNNDYEEKN